MWWVIPYVQFISLLLIIYFFHKKNNKCGRVHDLIKKLTGTKHRWYQGLLQFANRNQQFILHLYTAMSTEVFYLEFILLLFVAPGGGRATSG